MKRRRPAIEQGASGLGTKRGERSSTKWSSHSAIPEKISSGLCYRSPWHTLGAAAIVGKQEHCQWPWRTGWLCMRKAGYHVQSKPFKLLHTTPITIILLLCSNFWGYVPYGRESFSVPFLMPPRNHAGSSTGSGLHSVAATPAPKNSNWALKSKCMDCCRVFHRVPEHTLEASESQYALCLAEKQHQLWWLQAQQVFQILVCKNESPSWWDR